MDTMYSITWLFVAVFMFHEFEEIIFLQPYMLKNKGYIEKVHSKNRRVPFDFFTSTSSAALAIYEEFIILSLVALLSCFFNSYIIWYGLLGAFTIHLIGHIIFTLIYRIYVPGLVTSFVVLIPSVYLLYVTAIMTSYVWYALLISTVCASALMLINLEFLHKYVNNFDKWLAKLSDGK